VGIFKVKRKNRKKIILACIVAIILVSVVLVIIVVNRREDSQALWEEAANTYHNDLFGDHVYIFTPQDDPKKVQEVLDGIYEKQEANQFGTERYAVYFMPGTYDEAIAVNVGFYMQVSGLGMLPTETKIEALQCTARWLGDDTNHNACCNFWRGVENIEIGSNTMWAVSQATFMRRVQVDGALYLHDDYGWCSGGFLADSNIELMTDSGSQQQWLSRNDNWKAWLGDNWNLVFAGLEEGAAPEGTWPVYAYTTVEATPKIQEKPFLVYDKTEGFGVYVPAYRENATGTSWKNGSEGEFISLDRFYIAKAGEDTADTINAELAKGKNLILTPGIYKLTDAIEVTKPDTIVLGMGLATLVPLEGNACMITADVDGLNISGVLFDAGEKESDSLLVVGDEKLEAQRGDGYISLSDLFFRVGGTTAEYAAKTDNCVVINSGNVIGDNFWVWRADHGDNVGWELNTARNGIIINGDHVIMYALMVEHFQEYQTIWNGDNGINIMYQSELPYDVPNQESWKSSGGTVDGYASFKIGDEVKNFEAWGIGIYSYHRDAVVNEESAMEVPEAEGIKIHNICAIMITGNPGISHIINEDGEACLTGGERQIIREYQNGIIK
jgi:hypothetical protein